MKKTILVRSKQLKKSVLLFFMLTLTAITFTQAQERVQTQGRTCGTDEYMKQKLQDPEFAADYARRQAKYGAKLLEIQTQKADGTYQRKATLYIPVAVHFPTGTEANRACLEAHAQTQIDVINADYTKTNADHAAVGLQQVHFTLE